MKKKKITQSILVTALVISSFTSSFAQNADGMNNSLQTSNNKYANQGFYGGIHVTPQLSWMINKDDINNSDYKTESRFGAAFGLAGGYCFNNYVGVELNALYSLEGKKYKAGSREYTQKSEYIKVPLLFTYTTRPATFMFLGKIGPQLNILSQAKVDPAIVNGVTISDDKEQFKNVVIGGVASAGARYTIANNLWLDASLRYDITFSRVEDKSYKYFPAGRADTHNMTAGLEIGLNYLFK